MPRINIPPAALEAGLAAANALDPYGISRGQLTAAFEAMVAAWPGMQIRIYIEQAIILPLPQEEK